MPNIEYRGKKCRAFGCKVHAGRKLEAHKRWFCANHGDVYLIEARWRWVNT